MAFKVGAVIRRDLEEKVMNYNLNWRIKKQELKENYEEMRQQYSGDMMGEKKGDKWYTMVRMCMAHVNQKYLIKPV